jgi:hypothetical protein
MSFAADYWTAYELLRRGEPTHKTPPKSMNWGSEVRASYKNRVGVITAFFYAFKLVSEMRRQRALVEVLFPGGKSQDYMEEPQRSITLFPITVNKTTVQMRPLDDNGKG